MRCRSSLSSRAFWIAMTACRSEVLDQLDPLIGEGTNFLAVKGEGADQIRSLSASAGRTSRPHAAKFDAGNDIGNAYNVGRLGRQSAT